MKEMGENSMSQSDPTIEEATAYAEAYIKKNDRTMAFKRAFPKATGSKHSINVRASKLHKNDYIQLRIDQLQAASAKQTEEEFCVSVSDIKKMLLITAKNGIKKDKGFAVSALAELNKMDGNYAAETKIYKHEHMSDSELDERLKMMLDDL